MNGEKQAKMISHIRTNNGVSVPARLVVIRRETVDLTDPTMNPQHVRAGLS
jgi:hypothetical protein